VKIFKIFPKFIYFRVLNSSGRFTFYIACQVVTLSIKIPKHFTCTTALFQPTCKRFVSSLDGGLIILIYFPLPTLPFIVLLTVIYLFLKRRGQRRPGTSWILSRINKFFQLRLLLTFCRNPKNGEESRWNLSKINFFGHRLTVKCFVPVS